jgi:hypothetical protein
VTKTIVLGVLVLALAACAKPADSTDPKNANPSAGSEPGKSATDADKVEQTPKSKFTTNGSAKPTAAEVYNLGCKATGTYSPNYKLHPNLRTGQVTSWTSTKAYQGNTETLTYTQTIESVTSDSVTERISYLDASGHPAIKKGMSFRETCRLAASGDKEQCVPETTLPTREALASRILRCWIDTKGTKPNYSDAVGTLKLSNGKSIKAFKETMTVKGNILCDYEKGGIKNISSGTQARLMLYSNDVILDHFNYCGGPTVFWSTKIIDKKGNVLFANRLEALDMPIISENRPRTDPQSIFNETEPNFETQL